MTKLCIDNAAIILQPLQNFIPFIFNLQEAECIFNILEIKENITLHRANFLTNVYRSCIYDFYIMVL